MKLYARTRMPKSHDTHMKPSAICKATHDSLVEGHNVSMRRISVSYVLTIYSKWDILLMGNLDSLTSLFQHIRLRDINEGKDQIIAAIPRCKSFSVPMSNYQAPKPTGPSVLLGLVWVLSM